MNSKIRNPQDLDDLYSFPIDLNHLREGRYPSASRIRSASALSFQRPERAGSMASAVPGAKERHVYHLHPEPLLNLLNL